MFSHLFKRDFTVAANTEKKVKETIEGFIIMAMIAVGAWWYFTSDKPNDPPQTAAVAAPPPIYAELAETRLTYLYKLSIASVARCKSLAIEAAWYVDCRYGLSRGIYQASPDHGQRGFSVVPMSGKAMQHQAAGRMGDTVIRSADPDHSLDMVIAAFDAADPPQAAAVSAPPPVDKAPDKPFVPALMSDGSTYAEREAARASYAGAYAEARWAAAYCDDVHVDELSHAIEAFRLGYDPATYEDDDGVGFWARGRLSSLNAAAQQYGLDAMCAESIERFAPIDDVAVYPPILVRG